LPFSPREREIVMLIADGLSNREIGARLTLSTRTIEGHIYRAMARTGVASREELARLIQRSRQSS
jgi:DNA-binding CsgD family transcriptional regulator